MNLIINTVGGQLLTLTPEMLQEKLGLKSDILSLGIEVSDDNTAITAQSLPSGSVQAIRFALSLM